jgi:hypothetical protein
MRLTGLYQLPFSATGGNKILHGVFVGWQANAIVTIQAGLPIAAPSNAFATGVSPTVASPHVTHYFNTCYIDLSGNRRNFV